MKHTIPVMILAGGLGTRLREETEFRPKPMAPIGGKPILWHIMKFYSYYGFNRFIICLGYKGEMIKEYFLNYRLQGVDFTINTKTGDLKEHLANDEEWEVTLVDTGNDCQTGGRVARGAKYVDTDDFMLTYGDGLCNVDIAALFQFHKQHNKIATLTSIKNPYRFGNLSFDGDRVSSFMEKEGIRDNWINGGFFVLKKEFLRYLSTSSDCILERAPLSSAVKDGELMAYKHHGFWQCMDTLRDQTYLQEVWASGDAAWRVWGQTPRFKPAALDREKAKAPRVNG
jgi:glucose-1-phosphate cytidylyltransferase